MPAQTWSFMGPTAFTVLCSLIRHAVAFPPSEPVLGNCDAHDCSKANPTASGSSERTAALLQVGHQRAPGKAVIGHVHVPGLPNKPEMSLREDAEASETDCTEPDRQCDKKVFLDSMRDLIRKLGGTVVNPATEMRELSSLVNTLGAENNFTEVPVNRIIAELRSIASNTEGWLRLPPPDKGAVLWSMIRSDPWNCELIPEFDRRHNTCDLPTQDDSLNPHLLNCAPDDQCTIEHANSFRTLHRIGALPCCPTPPFCAAPVCAAHQEPEKEDKAAVCTKKPHEEYVIYMKAPESWPAYHGWGGAFELDALKLLDALGCGNGTGCTEAPETPFDLVVDIGANTGYYTEKLTGRNFAKNYLLIEANPNTAALLKERWGDEEWKEAWFTQQVPHTALPRPDFEIISSPLSNRSNGVLDMCITELSMNDTEAGCIVPVTTLDVVLRNNLSSAFQTHFRNARSMFVKVDTEGMDELVLRGMANLLEKTNGEHEDGSPKYVVNFLQFEYAPELMNKAKEREGFDRYDIKTLTEFLESVGFESFLIGPKYLPMSHGSWNEEYKIWPEDPVNNAGVRLNYPNFQDTVCWWCTSTDKASFTSDVFAIRSTHPRATELKLALGACKESKDFDLSDPQYSFTERPPPEPPQQRLEAVPVSEKMASTEESPEQEQQRDEEVPMSNQSEELASTEQSPEQEHVEVPEAVPSNRQNEDLASTEQSQGQEHVAEEENSESAGSLMVSQPNQLR